MRYMGTKRSLAASISDAISRRHPNATILDAFSGLCAVGSELAPKHVVFANDIHHFAENVARSILLAPLRAQSISSVRDAMLPHYEENLGALREAVGELYDLEDRMLARANSDRGLTRFRLYALAQMAKSVPRRFHGLPTLERYKGSPQTFPYSLATQYFSNAYFGLRQAMQIDSIRYAIDCVAVSSRARLLCALSQAMSLCSASPGHFAQFFVPRDDANSALVVRMRRRDLFSAFVAALEAVKPIQCYSRTSNRTFCSDATTLLETKRGYLSGLPLIVYADPPYSRAQYSRYYHLLETIALYDYPACDGKGRYRQDRHLTGFSHKAHVADAMDAFVSAASDTGAGLYFSYPSNGLLQRAGECVEDVLSTHYRHVSLLAEVPIRHSTMGGAPGVAAYDALERIYFASDDRRLH